MPKILVSAQSSLKLGVLMFCAIHSDTFNGNPPLSLTFFLWHWYLCSDVSKWTDGCVSTFSIIWHFESNEKANEMHLTLVLLHSQCFDFHSTLNLLIFPVFQTSESLVMCIVVSGGPVALSYEKVTQDKHQVLFALSPNEMQNTEVKLCFLFPESV